MDQTPRKTYSRGQILRTTQRNVLRAIDKSLNMTLNSLLVAEDGSERSKELFETSLLLQGLKQTFHAFKNNNNAKFQEE